MNSNTNRPLIGITMGDPGGIGPEILVKSIVNKEIQKISKPVVLGDAAIMEEAVNFLDASMEICILDRPDQFKEKHINLLPSSSLDPETCKLSSPTRESGKAMADYITRGTSLAMDNQIQALVTCPITKTGLQMAGIPFPGHTELIASQTNTQNFAMMLAGTRLKVVLVTIHMPLNKVAANLTQETIIKKVSLTRQSLIHRFGISSPKIAVAGLNPHAGESSMFGREEESIILPAVNQAKKMGIDLEGPLPPDTVFYHAVNGKYDAVICMYHDQGLIPFKLVHFKDGVNTTLGLPIIRTSVDHGTAYDIAWKGIAHPDSLIEAIKMAVHQAENRTDI